MAHPMPTGAASLTQGLGNAAYFHTSYSAQQLGTDILFGGVTGGVIGGATAAIKGNNLWTGLAKGPRPPPGTLPGHGSVEAPPSPATGELGGGKVEILDPGSRSLRPSIQAGPATIDGTDLTIGSSYESFKPNVPVSGGDGGMLSLASGVLNKHHVLPQQFRLWFSQRGIANIDDYTIRITENTHKYGVHGKGMQKLPGKWNSEWAEFIRNNPNAEPSHIFHQAENMLHRWNF